MIASKRLSRIAGTLCCVFGSALCGAAWAAFSASADRTQLSAGEVVQLTLQSDHSGTSEPDLAPLAKDFEIVGRASSKSLQFINGSLSSQRQLRLTLSPRRSGRIEVPRLQWDGEASTAIELNVASNGAGATGGGTRSADPAADAVAHVFMTTTLDAARPYVQSAVALQVRLYSDQKLFQATVELTGNTDALVQRVGKDVTTQEVRDGRNYQVITRHYIVVAQRSGEIQLDGPVLNAQVADGKSKFDPIIERLFGQLQIEGGLTGTRPLRLRGDAITLSAQPRPPGLRSNDWLPAQQLTLEDAWQPANAVVTVGEPVTRRLRLSAVGLTAPQLPDLSTVLTELPGLVPHPTEAKLADEVQDGHIVGHREQDIAFIADRVGRFDLPALRVGWWDVARQQRREAVLPAFTVEAVADPNAAPAAPGAASSASLAAAAADSATAPAGRPDPTSASAADAEVPATTDTPAVNWTGVSLVFGLLWLGTLGAWAWTHRHRDRPTGSSQPAPVSAAREPSATAARRQFQQACRNNAARPARDALLAWGRATWPKHAPTGLNALARRLGQTALTPLLRDLDRACLEDTPWNGNALVRALTTLDDNSQPAKAIQDLPGLYSDPNP